MLRCPACKTAWAYATQWHPDDGVPVCPRCAERMEAPTGPRAVGAFAATALRGLGYLARPWPLLTHALTCLAIAALGYVPLAGPLLALCVAVGYLFAVVRSTTLGEEAVRPSPEEIPHRLTLWTGTLLRLLCVVLASQAPALALAWLTRDAGPEVILAALLGLAYLPAGLAAASQRAGLLHALDPRPALELVRAVPAHYALTVGLVTLLVGATVALRVVLGASALGAPALLTGLAMAAHQLGLLVREALGGEEA